MKYDFFDGNLAKLQVQKVELAEMLNGQKVELQKCLICKNVEF